MSLNGSSVNTDLSSATSAEDNLNAACQGIITTHLAPSSSPWYAKLSGDLAQAQSVAAEWRNQLSTQMRSEVLACILHCGQQFLSTQAAVNALFDRASTDLAGAKAGLSTAFASLSAVTNRISTTVSGYEDSLRAWGIRLQQAHDAMAATIGDIQAQANALQNQIGAANAALAGMQAQIDEDRRAIEQAQSSRTSGIIETVFGVVFAPVTGGLSLILAGIGVSSIVEAQSKVEALQKTIDDYQKQIFSAQQNLNQEQMQIVALSGLRMSAGIALSDMENAGQFLDHVRTTWDAFFQELSGTVAKIANAQKAADLVVEKAWFNAACLEFGVIVSGVQGLIGASVTSTAVNCLFCDVPIVRLVPLSMQPPLPSDLKMTVLTGPDVLTSSSEAPVLSWGAYTYWAASFFDNRLAMCILAVDSSNRVVKQVEKSGARYVWKMQLQQNTLVCYGQSNAAISVPLPEIQITGGSLATSA